MPFTPDPDPTTSELDLALTAQLIVAWSGESSPDEPRLRWWDTDLTSEFGGEDFFRRLLPDSWRWATLRAVREAARRTDAALRHKHADADRILSLYSLGFELDERLDERLDDHMRAHTDPHAALPDLAQVIVPAAPAWAPDRFETWARLTRRPDTETTSVGRRLRGAPPPTLGAVIHHLTAALTPIAPAYPLPHYRLA